LESTGESPLFIGSRPLTLHFGMPHKTILTVVLLPLTVSWNLCAAQDQQQLQYAVVYSDSRDVTHFREEHLPWQTTQGFNGNVPVLTTPLLAAEKIGFLRLPKGYRTDWHPAPSKRFIMVLSGVAEVEVGDGQRRKFGPGTVLLVTDAQGRGHRTMVLGNQEVFVAWVPVP
jgi:quercetin dioxygenase-like cupin family protein